MNQPTKNIFDRIRTDKPLLWNTRFPQMMLALIVAHLFFFAGGYLSLDISSLRHYDNLLQVGGISLYWFSILCSIGFLIVWLVYFLRNNAFKVYYQIGKSYFLCQWIIIFVIVGGSISFYESFHAGVAVKIRKLIPEATLVKEANILNRASSFMPVDRFNYFILNSCENDSTYYESNRLFNAVKRKPYDTITEYAEVEYHNDSARQKLIFEALQKQDAFRHIHYCRDKITLASYPGFISAKERQTTRVEWLNSSNIDSIQNAIRELLDLFKKYSFRHNFSADSIARMNISDSLLHLEYLDGDIRNYSDYETYEPANMQVENNKYEYFLIGKLGYLNYQFKNILNLADERYREENSRDERRNIWPVLFYIITALSLFLFTYRLLSRKVFLWSIVASIVLVIFLSLITMASASADTSFPVGVLFIFGLLLITALFTHYAKAGNKTFSGVALTLLAWLLPYILLFVVILADQYLTDHTNYLLENPLRDKLLQRDYPISFWISHNSDLIIRCNLLLVFLLIGFVFPRLARKWHGKAEE